MKKWLIKAQKALLEFVKRFSAGDCPSYALR